MIYFVQRGTLVDYVKRKSETSKKKDMTISGTEIEKKGRIYNANSSFSAQVAENG